MDERTFEEKILLLEPKLYRMACAVLRRDADADDAMQEAILRAWRRLPLLREESRFDAWVTRILINECRDLMRRRKRQGVPYDEKIGETQAYQAPEDTGLREALRALPEKFRLPLLLHHMDGYPLEEVARIMRLPVSTVKGRLYEARKKLKTLLTSEEAQK